MDKAIVNLGCGNVPMEGAINVDLAGEAADVRSDIFEWLAQRPSKSVDEIYADQVIEHFPFEKEQTFFKECMRILKHNGKLTVTVPNFEWLCKTFLEASENEYQFYQSGADSHYFGGGYDSTKRWSYLVATFFGHQDGSCQTHMNAYTIGKLYSIGIAIGAITMVTNYTRKETECLRAVYKKHV